VPIYPIRLSLATIFVIALIMPRQEKEDDLFARLPRYYDLAAIDTLVVRCLLYGLQCL
jgi:hypothetical protein